MHGNGGRAILGWAMVASAMTGCGTTQQQVRTVPAPVPVGGPTEAMAPQPRDEAPRRADDPALRPLEAPVPSRVRRSPLRFRWLSAAVAGTDVQIRAPEGADVRKIAGVTTVNWGAGFSVELRKAGEDLQTQRQLITANPVLQVRGVVAEMPDAFVYETAPLDPGRANAVSFLTVRDLGGQRFSCQNTQGYGHDRAQVQVMLDACRSLTLEKGATEAF